jgi:AcrR family transcriptional regulator
LQRLQFIPYGRRVTDVDTPCTLSRRDRKKQQTRDALMTAALRLVAERGLDHVTVEDIAEAADVSSRTFFNYFAGKDDALLGDKFADGDLAIQRFRAAGPTMSVVEALRFALRPAFELMESESEIWFLRLRVVGDNPSLLPRMVTRSVAVEQELSAAVAERIGVGAEHGYPPLVTSVLGAVCRTAMTRWAASGGSRRLTDLVDEAFGMIAGGLADPSRPLSVGPRRPADDL